MLITFRTKNRTLGERSSLYLAIVVTVLLLVSCAPQPEAQQERTEPTSTSLVPADWKPSLEQVHEDLEEGIATQPNQSQQALNRASQNLADLVDAQLFITYVLLLRRLDEKGRAALLKEQETWLTQRAASAQAAVVSQGGSLAPLEYATAFGSITKKRLAELEARLAQQSTQAGDMPGKGE